ncbi:hypothetical protein AOLI_G00016210 [Acnodon oligacanthus]
MLVQYGCHSSTKMIERVIFCVFLETDYEIYKRKMSDFFPPDNKEHKEGEMAQSEDDSKTEAPKDDEMLSQAQEDGNMDNAGTQSQKSENNTAADENPKDGNEMDIDGSNTVEDVNPPGEHKAEEEMPEQKKGESGDAAEREPGGEEKIQSAPEDAQAQQEKDQAKNVDAKKEDSQGGAEAMEGIDDGDKNPTPVANDDEVSNAKVVELKHQDEIPPEPNQPTQTDSSQSKDGSADKNDPKKE